MKHSHSICVLTHENDGVLYGKINAYLAKDYAVVYAVESSDVEDTVRRMSNAGIEPNYIKEGGLTILNRNFVYSRSETNFEGRLLLERWKSILSEVKGSFKGITVMGMPEPFFETVNHQKLVEYEQLVCREFDGSFEAICCYTTRSIAELPLKYLISLLNAHQHVVKGVEESIEWHPTRILDIINRGFERTVGKKTSKVAFEAMKHLYKIDERMAISRPEVLEYAFRKMFADTTDTIIDTIKVEIIKEILFEHNNGLQSHDVKVRNPHFLLCPSCHWSATAILDWKPDFCPICQRSVVRSVPLNFTDPNRRQSLS